MLGPGLGDHHLALAREWRRLGRAATLVALLTSPATLLYLHVQLGWGLLPALLAALALVVVFRGFVDVVAHRLIPRASLYGADEGLQRDDVVARRRHWYWLTRFRRLTWLVVGLGGTLLAVHLGLALTGRSGSVGETLALLGSVVPSLLVGILPYLFIFPLLFFGNLIILFGPLLFFALKQMKGYEPGDADWGVRLDDVRGQSEPKEDVTRVIALWQSGEEFRRAGGKPERGLLFIGAPGTGKTMLSKGIATSFNSPIVTMPGSGFQQAFMGMDVVVVMMLVRKARKLARKWGGQCIVFIDEIDAVGLRRQALGGGVAPGMVGEVGVQAFEDLAFYGPWGALTPTGDLVLETRAWRERLFAARREPAGAAAPPWLARLAGFMMPGGMGGAGLALNQLLVQMDGVDEPKWSRKFLANRVNTVLDAMYLVPQRLGPLPLRLRPPKPRDEQIYFIGATNVPLERLDPALVRPGRMGRHIWFRTPTKDDRLDVFDLYLGKVEHEPELDTERRRDELARITNGYSPAMIEQVCSMALTFAHAEGRRAFRWEDVVEAMTTIESGTAQRVEYVPEETRAVAIHEAGHAAASHVYMRDVLSTRLSIRKRGGSLGHHQAIEKEERFSSWRSEEYAKLVWTLGAMAAEHVFYGENSTGVGGDVESATRRAAWMVGVCGMGPEPIDLGDAEREAQAMERFGDIGQRILNRAQMSSPMGGDPIGAILADAAKRRAAAQILGQAYLAAKCLVEANRDKVETMAELLIERRELHGDEVVEVLDRLDLVKPDIDLRDEAIWPRL